nr:hypothetical protein [Tanacetum cinerariifolium]
QRSMDAGHTMVRMPKVGSEMHNVF